MGGPVTGGTHVLAVHAAETVLAWFIGVLFSVLAVNFTLATESPVVLGAVLRVFGAVVVDACPLYLILKGYSAAEYVSRHTCGPAHRRLVLCTAVPQLVVACLCHFVLQLMTAPEATWDWISIGLSPVMGSAVADVRLHNTPRGVSECGWLVQAHTLFVLFAFEIHAQVQKHTARLFTVTRWLLLAIWIPGAVSVVGIPSQFVTMATRNPIMNLHFFTAGVVAHVLQTMPEKKVALFAAVPRNVLAALAAVAAVVYLHHLDPYDEPDTCVSVFGGAPCLWRFDASNSRFFPVHFAAVMWLVDADGGIPPSLCGPLTEPLTVTLAHVNGRVSSLREYGTSWILFGQFLATALHKLAGVAAPGLLVRFAYIVIPVEAFLVSAAVVLLRRVTVEPFTTAYDTLETRLFGPPEPVPEAPVATPEEGHSPGESSPAVHI